MLEKKYVVRICFYPNGKQYEYLLPDNIDVEDIGDYVVVENKFYDKNKDASPYKIVKVVGVYKTTYSEATQPLVDFIDTTTFKEFKEKDIALRKQALKADALWDSLSPEMRVTVADSLFEVMRDKYNIFL